jgi:biopolymer transport protein ExbD
MRSNRPGYFDASRPRVEVIPMIDIMMFLLVFFVVISLKMIAGTGVDMELPGSTTTQEMRTSTITVGVTKGGASVVEGKTLTQDALKERLIALKKNEHIEVVLAGDKDVPLQTLLQVMDTVRAAGITSVGIAATADKAKPEPAAGKAPAEPATPQPAGKR